MNLLTLPIPIPDEEVKFLFSHFFIVPQKGFIRVFIKPFEAQQKSVKWKFYLIFISIQLSEMHG